MTRILIVKIKSLKGMFSVVRVLAATCRLKQSFKYRARNESKKSNVIVIKSYVIFFTDYRLQSVVSVGNNDYVEFITIAFYFCFNFSRGIQKSAGTAAHRTTGSCLKEIDYSKHSFKWLYFYD